MLTQLNLKVKDQNTKLRRLYSFKQEKMKKAIFIQDIIYNQTSQSLKISMGNRPYAI